MNRPKVKRGQDAAVVLKIGDVARQQEWISEPKAPKAGLLINRFGPSNNALCESVIKRKAFLSLFGIFRRLLGVADTLL